MSGRLRALACGEAPVPHQIMKVPQIIAILQFQLSTKA
jgi:hypothetical protein